MYLIVWSDFDVKVRVYSAELAPSHLVMYRDLREDPHWIFHQCQHHGLGNSSLQSHKLNNPLLVIDYMGWGGLSQEQSEIKVSDKIAY